MKRFLFLTALTSILLTACEINPHADFSINNSLVEPNEDVYFTNLSSDADSYFWDFGDGYSSYAVNPIHYYDREGTYTATLTARHHRGGSDVAQASIEVHWTKLEITVAEWNANYVIQNVIPDASVRLYPTLYDWDNETNMIIEGTTDAYGVVVFSGLDPVSYYIDVWAPNYDNFLIRDELPELIGTEPLLFGHVNTFTAWVDYYALKSQKARRDINHNSAIYKSKRTLNSNKLGK